MNHRFKSRRVRKRSSRVAPTLLRFCGYVQPYRVKLFITLALVLAVAGLQVVAPYLIGVIVDRLTQNSPAFTLALPLAAFAFVLIVRLFLALWRNCLMQQIGMRISCDMRIRIFEHLQKLSLRFYDSRHTGKVVSRITEDAGSLNGLISVATVNIMGDTIGIVGVIVVLLYMNVPLAIMSVILLPFFAFNYLWHRRRLRFESRRHRHNWDRAVGFLHERISNSRVVKAFTAEDMEVALFRDRIEQDYFNFNQIVRRNAVLGFGAELISGIGTLVILLYGAFLVRRGKGFTIGDLVAFYSYLPLLYAPIVRLVDSNATIQRAATALEKINTLLNAKPHVQENNSMPAMPPIQGAVRFENVSFGYRDGQEVLRQITFQIEPGKMVALVGPSGAGKSTIAALLTRFYDPKSGAVTIDGNDIRQFNLQSVRRQIGIVMQESVLFADTIANNIRYGCPGVSDEAVIEAAVAANAHPFITRFKNGYHSQVGERGVQLSGGERQRIAIARVILKNPRILIFDEATSSLDSHSENVIMEATERLMTGRTSLVIAHRLSTVVKADRILVVQEGGIIDHGTHQELIQRPGFYRDFHDLQVSKGRSAFHGAADGRDGTHLSEPGGGHLRHIESS